MADTNTNATENTNDGAQDAGTEGTQKILLVDDVCVVVSGDATENLTAPIFIAKPEAGENIEVALQPGQKYVFDFAEDDVQSFIQDGSDLNITFADGSVVTLTNFEGATSSPVPSTLAFSDRFTPDAIDQVEVVDTTPSQDELEEPQAEVRETRGDDEVASTDETEGEGEGEQVANIEPAAGDEPSAADVANIEPAAGDEAGGPENTGQGPFRNPDNAPVGPLAAVGPLDPTALQYGVEFQNDTLFPEEGDPEEDDPTLLSPAPLALDETFLGPLSVSDTLNFSFGNDGPGTLTPDGTSSVGGSLLGGNLTSGGTPVTINPTADGYEGVLPGGAPVFTLTIDPQTGFYEFTQILPIDHADGTDPNDVIDLTFGVQATDNSGDIAQAEIVIQILDDAPAIAAPAIENINETALSGGPITVSDTLTVDFGNDVAGTVTPNGNDTVTGVTSLTSGGQPVTITATPTGYIGTLPGGATAFELVVNPANGAYIFTQNVNLDHDPANDTISLGFGVNVTDFDGDSTETTITINIVDSVPEINDNPTVGAGIEVVDETNLPGGSNASGSIDVDFGSDTPGALTSNGVTNVTGSVAGGTLTSNGNAVTITQTATGYVGTINGGADTVFTLTIDPSNGDYAFNQILPLDHADTTDPDDAITIEFGVTATDSDGDTDTGSITITVRDDGPDITDPAVQTVDEDSIVDTANGDLSADFGSDGAGNVSATGTSSFSGVPALTSGGLPVTITPSANGYVGSTTAGDVFTLTINPATGTYTFQLLGTLDHGAGDLITLSFGAEIVDFDGDTDQATIRINVADDKPEINDNPTVGAGIETVDETNLPGGVSASGSVDVDFGNDAPGALTPNGTVTTSVPVTSGGQPVTITPTADGYVGTINGGADTVFTLTIDSSNGDYTFTQLAPLDHPDATDPNDPIQLQFGITATDSDGDTDTGSITINVLDDGPIAHDDCNTFDITSTNQDYNVVLVLDVSGSMGGEKLALLKSSVANLLGDFAATGGEVKVHLVPFAANAGAGQTFTITDAADFTNAINFLNGLSAGGTTNYEAPLQSAISWLNGDSANDPIAGADTYTYFISDGAPNRFINGSGNVQSGSADTVIGEITGTDGSDEVTALQNLSTEVIGVGIGVDGTTLGRIAVIDSDGNALDVQDPNDLSAALGGTTPVAGTATGNVITGENGGPGAADTLSQDVDTTVTSISFNGTTIAVDPVTGASIDGDHGTLVIMADGSYTYNVTDNTITSDITEQFVYTLTDHDGDTSRATLTLKGNAPLAIDTEALTVDETDLNPTDTDSGVVTATLEAGVTATYNSNDVFTSSVALTSNNTPVTVSVVGNDYVGTAGGNTIFTLVLNQTTGEYTFNLIGVLDHPDATNPNDGISLNFGVAVDASDGDNASGSIQVTVLDDGPVAVDDTTTVAQNTTTITGNVTDNDDGGADVVAEVTNIRFNGTDFPIVPGIPAVVTTPNGTLTIDSNGAYTYVSNGTNTNIVFDNFEYTLTDFDGDTDTATLKVKIVDINTKPEIVGSEVTVDETDIDGAAPTGQDSASNSVTGNFGADGPGTFTLDNLTGFTGATNNQLTSNGVAVDVQNEAGDLVGRAGGTEVFRLELNETTGEYTFTLLEPLDHADTTDPDDTIELNFGVTGTDTDGDTDTGTITVNVKDDGPVIHSKARPIDEDGLANGGGPISYTHTLSHDYGEDGPGEIRPTDNFMATFQVGGQAQTLTSGGNTITVTATANGYVGTINGGADTIFTLTIQNNGEYTYTQFSPVDHPDGTNPDDVIWLKFGVEIVDHDGDTDPATIIVDLHDGGPDANDDHVTVDQNNTTANGNLTDNDQDGPDVEATVTNIRFNGTDFPVVAGTPTVVNGQHGVLTVNSDGSYTYVANGTNTTIVQDVFTYTLTDFDGDTDTARLKVNIEDVDVRPEVTGSEVTVDETDIDGAAPTGEDSASNSVTGNFGVDGPGTFALNTLTGFNGATNNQLTSNGVAVDVQNEAGDLVGRAGGTEVFRLELNETTGEYTFTLLEPLDHADTTDPDDTIELNFGVTGTDIDGDTDTGTITVNVKDDGPEAGGMSVFPVSENDIENTPAVVTRNLNGDFGEDGAGQYELNGDFNLHDRSSLLNGQLSSGGVPVSVAFAGNTATGTANGETVFTLELNPQNGQHTFTLFKPLDHANANASGSSDVIWLKFGVDIVDFDGDRDSTVIQVDVRDTAPVANDDHRDVEGTPVVGNVTDNDDVNADQPGAVTSVTINGQATQIANGQTVTVAGQNGTLEIASDGSYTYTPAAGAQGQDSFTYTLRDFDGDTDDALLKFKVDNVDDPVFIVGENVDDVAGETTPWVVGNGNGEITGRTGNDLLVGDAGGSTTVNQDQDYNFVFVLDTSGSMGTNDPNDGQTTRVEILIDAVKGLMSDFAAYQNGAIKAHLVSFSTNVKSTFTVDFSSPTALADVTAYLNAQTGNGLTNYESPLQAANAWLAGNEPLGGDAITTTYFISDGQPNRYVNDQGVVQNPPGNNAEEDAIILAEITGTSTTTSDGTFGDNTNEVGELQSYGEVVGVGIAIGDNNNLNTIDSDGAATYIDDPNDLAAVLQGANPLNQLAATGGDNIQGGDRDDMIFGDVLMTDDLADQQGLGTNDGAGFEVFERLENGEGNDANWDREDTINYIRANAESLAGESVNAQGEGRDGGDDIIDGGAGDDTIFGQEGDDQITGGAGDDTIYGGSGADKFLFDAITDGVDTIKDFDATEGDQLDVSALLQGYDALQDSINDFVFATEVAGDTVISVDETGSGNAANATQIAVLEAVTGLDLEQITNNGETTI